MIRELKNLELEAKLKQSRQIIASNAQLQRLADYMEDNGLDFFFDGSKNCFRVLIDNELVSVQPTVSAVRAIF